MNCNLKAPRRLVPAQVPSTVIALFNLTLGEQGAGLVKLSNSAFLGVLFWGLALCAPHGGFMLELARISTDLAKHAPPRGHYVLRRRRRPRPRALRRER